MPICQKCGSYFSEKSCPFCTPDDSPESPVSTIEKEESKAIRIIDPIDLIESIENTESQIKQLQEKKELEIQGLTEEVDKKTKIERKLKTELDTLDSELSQLEGSFKNKREDKQNLLRGKFPLEEEIESLKSKLAILEADISSRKTEISQLKEQLGET
ncbi:MAG: coiled-coil domain-containing protein [Promethearchaeota archaeon]